jgi:hypothetical protein
VALERAIVSDPVRVHIIVAVLVLLVLGSGTASASQDPYRDQAEQIACPPAPPDWFNPPESAGGRAILTPLTPESSGLDPTVFFGAPVVEVDCHYLTAGGKNMEVGVRYALPIDINPWNDFDIGCTVTGHPEDVATAAQAWNNRERIYRVIGANTWSLATFVDDLGQLGPADVPRFERIADMMLRAAQPFAHNCKLAGDGGPVDVTSIWTFSFDAQTTSGGVTGSATTSGSFHTTANTSGGSVGTISNLVANDFRLRVTGGGTTRSLQLHVGAPIEFRHGYGSLLRTVLVVIASNDPGCRPGASGTLLLSLQPLTAPSVAVQVCGHTYLDGTGRVSAALGTV